MDGSQKQIVSLHQKVDRLNEIVERLSDQLNILTNQRADRTDRYSRSRDGDSLNFRDSFDRELYEDHKDILLDNGSRVLDPSLQGESNLSAETQIRRLTAQLTAAYNRIAALEERLLAYRIRS